MSPAPFMTSDELERRRDALFAEHGITPVESCVFWTVEIYGGGNRSESLAEDAYANTEKAHLLCEYEAAVAACLEKGWLRILMQADCDQDKERWQNKPAHGIWNAEVATETEYVPGNVDFTEAGARLYHHVDAASDALRGEKPHEGITCYTWHLPNMVRIWGAYKEDLAAQLQIIQRIRLAGDASRRIGFASGEQITRIDGPHQIDGWWMTRFVYISPGWYANIYYTPHYGQPPE